ncbi:cellulase family glycosylhydrolase [Algoriphagus vanfongensis]|uniref:cellulase family glycosylhydrolase n=1 Tax=Algoriphagus vanfongensis TaxID=426371 RepID=UPI000422A032|nr:cellulase family glycosylhydrolase [Algoriphagus vanfongensis]
MKNPLNLTLRFLLCLVLFSCGGNEDPEPIYLSIDPEIIQADGLGETFSVAIQSNAAWQANTTSDWVLLDQAQGSGDGSLQFTLEPNPTSTSREATVRISVTGLLKNLSITQAGSEAPRPDFYIPADPTGMRDMSSLELSQMMGAGWNLGNSLEAIGGETAWGNPVVTASLIAQIKNLGFQSIRIPVAWSKLVNEESYEIDPAWISRVEEVVKYALDQDLFVVLNNHWDGGWMQPTFEEQDEANERLEQLWIQVALRFRDYDDRLLFAGSNEVLVEGNYGNPSAENLAVQNGFNQIFVNTVRSTGGRNAYRHLVVQSYNTVVDYAIDHFLIPEDEIEGRLMLETHYYDPWEFALRDDDLITQWGSAAIDPDKKAIWGNEDYADTQFGRLKSKFIDQGIPVIMGEFGAVSKPSDPANHSNRKHYLDYLSIKMKENGIVPFYWDNGFAGEYGFALIDRSTESVIHQDLIEVLVK